MIEKVSKRKGDKEKEKFEKFQVRKPEICIDNQGQMNYAKISKQLCIPISVGTMSRWVNNIPKEKARF